MPEVEIRWQASPTASRPKKLYGPASLRNGVIIYPCDRFGCRIWCSCVLCRKKNENSLDEEIILDLNSHKVYHKALHPECDFCLELYSIFPALKLEKHHQIIFEHYTKKSSSRQKLKCPACDLNFTRTANTLRHCKSQHAWERYPCKQCKATFKRKDVLKSHVDDVHEYDTKCKGCNTKFVRDHDLTRHIKARLDKEGHAKFKCEICKKKFSSNRFLDKHNRNQENICEDCGKIFGRNIELIRHRNTPKVHCDLCETELCNKKQLVTHKLNIHPQEIKCEICDKIFPRRFNLKRHIVRVHGES